jgi:hypothetical protein
VFMPEIGDTPSGVFGCAALIASHIRS